MRTRFSFSFRYVVSLLLIMTLQAHAQMSKVMSLKAQADLTQKKALELTGQLHDQSLDEASKQEISKELLEKAAQIKALNNIYKRALQTIRTPEAIELLKLEYQQEALERERLLQTEAKVKESIYKFYKESYNYENESDRWLFRSVLFTIGILVQPVMIGALFVTLMVVAPLSTTLATALMLPLIPVALMVTSNYIYNASHRVTSRILTEDSPQYKKAKLATQEANKAIEIQNKKIKSRVKQIEGEIFRRIDFYEMVNLAAAEGSSNGSSAERGTMP